MPAFTSSGWPAGAVVMVHPGPGPDGGPAGAVVTSAAADAFGRATFSGLEEGGRYVASDGVTSRQFMAVSRPHPAKRRRWRPPRPPLVVAPAVAYLRGVVTNVSTGLVGGAPPTNTSRGTYGIDYIDEPAGTYTYLASRGHRAVFALFMLERLFPTPRGPADAAELQRMRDAASCVAAAGMRVTFQPFNKGGYSTSAGVQGFGSAGYPVADYTDALARLAQEFQGDAAVVGLSLDNEPTNVHRVLTISGGERIGNTSFETDVSGWSAVNATLARSTSRAQDGAASMVVTAAAGGDMSAATTVSVGSIPTAGELVVRHYVTHEGAARLSGSVVDWFDGGGGYLTSTTSGFANDTAAFVERQHGHAKPAGAATATVSVKWLACAAAEAHRVDLVRAAEGSYPGKGAAWEPVAQAAHDAIRAAGWTKRIVVPLGDYSGAPVASTLHPSGPWIRVASAYAGMPLAYEAHHYFDHSVAGGYSDSYATEVANAQAAGFTAGTNATALHSRSIAELDTFISWLGGHKGVVAEVNVPNNADVELWKSVLDAWFVRADRAQLDVFGWNVGRDTDPLLRIYDRPAAAGAAVDRPLPQASTFEAHPSKP